MARKFFGLIEATGLADVLPVSPSNFKQFSIQDTLTIPSSEPDIEHIASVSADIAIKNTYVINTPTGNSFEGQKLTGKNLIVEGLIIQKVEYAADEPAQSIYAAYFEMPFCTYIVLPADFSTGTPIQTAGYIEDIFAELLNKRSIFKNVTILLDARF